MGIYKEEFAAYEDMGVILEAFIRWRRGELKYPVEGVLRYKDDKVVLATLFRRRGIASEDELHRALSLDGPTDWGVVYPSIDWQKVLQRMCRFIFVDCQRNQTQRGVDAYNRL